MRVVVGSFFPQGFILFLIQSAWFLYCVFFQFDWCLYGFCFKVFCFSTLSLFPKRGAPWRALLQAKGLSGPWQIWATRMSHGQSAVAGKGTGKFGLGPLACERLKLGAFGNQSGRPWGRYTSDPYRKPKGKRQENGKPGKPDTSNLSLPGWAVAASSSQSPSPCR